MNRQQFIDYGRSATQAIVTLMLKHQLSILRFRQHVRADGSVSCATILQCTDRHLNEILDAAYVDPLVDELERVLGALQSTADGIQGNYSCYVLPKYSELPAGIMYRLAEGGDDLIIEAPTVDEPDYVIACNLGLCLKTQLYTYLTYRE